MGLRIWLPLLNNLDNKGTSNFNITSVESSPTYVDGKIGKCYQRANSSSQLTNGLKIDNNLVDLFGSTASVAVWVKPLGTHTHYNGTVLSSGNWNAKKWAFGVSQDNTKVDVLCGSYNNYITCAVPVNEWTHLASIYDNGVCTLYKNGIYIGQLTGQAAFVSDADWTGIGRETYAGGYFGFNGCIADLRVFDHCLSAAEVREISQGLVLHYKLDNYKTTPTTIINSTINDTAYNASISKYGYNTTSNLAKTSGTFQGKQCIKVSTITAGQTAQPYAYFSNIFTSNGANQPAYKTLDFDYYTTCPTTTWLNIYKLGNGAGTATWSTYSSTAGMRSGIYTNSQSGSNLLVQPNEWNHIQVTFHGTTDANAEWGYCINGPAHTSNANYYFLYANIQVVASNSLTIEDSSGYNLNATTNGTFETINSGGRFNKATRLACSAPTTSDETDITYILSPLSLTTPNQMTVAWWAKPESGYSGGTGHAAFCTSVNSRPTDYNATAMHHRDAGFDLCPNSGSSIRLTFNQYTANQWNHYAITYDGQKAIAYKDGVALTNASMAAAGPLKSFNNIWIGYSQAGGVKRKTLGSYSDFRVYVTALDADAIRQLYEVGAKVDNKQNLHTYELNEFGTNQLTKTGIMKDYMVEPYKILPDGSCWQLMMFHYVDSGKNLFTRDNASYCNDFGLYSRLRDIDKYKYTDTLYEFYVIQDDLEYRWTQTNAPTVSSSPGTVTTVSGYNNPSVGLAKNGSNTYLGYNSWWGACGCWTIWNGNAIPGFGGRNCTKYLTLYVRIPKSKFELATQNAYAENFIEL